MHFVTTPMRHLAAAAILLCTTASQAVEMPTLDDPQFAGWAQQANAEMEKFLRAQDSYFAMPAQGQPFPCEVPPELLSKIIGARLPGVPMSDEEKRAWARTTRDMPGMKPMEFVDVVVRPVQASCKDGKPDGRYAGWVEFTMVNSGLGNIIRTRFRKYIETDVGPEGRRPGLAIERQVQLDASTEWGDPAVAEMMRKNPPPKASSAMFIFNETLPGKDAGVRQLSLMRVSVTGPAGYDTITTSLMVPTGPKAWRMVSYNGRQKAYEATYRDGRPHGLQSNYAYRLPNGIQVPASSICWDHGEQIKTTQCNVD
ncbi:hypothetical protein [Ramlibacter humi]|uniref:hypothetical protein n=1 Tax=Ramlibacter humi TaxID=2530451 RepID=UPI00142FFF24|nr:hypothetical protein [Ramlibacter humi]